MQAISRDRWAYVAAIVSSWGWASMYPAAKLVLEEVQPLHVAWTRAAVACVGLVVLTVLRMGGVRPGLARLAQEACSQPLGLVALGTLSFVGTSLLAMTAQSLLSASVNALLNNLGPLWLAIGAVVLGRASRPGSLLVGSLLALVGVALVVSSPGAAPDGGSWWASLTSADPRGVALALVGSILIAASVVLARRIFPGRDAIAATALATGWAAVVLTPIVLAYAGGFAPFGEATLASQLILVYLGLGSTAFNFALWHFALGRLPVTQIAHFQYLVPLLGVALGVVILGEPLTVGLFMGGAAILGGMLLAQRGAEPLPSTARPLES